MLSISTKIEAYIQTIALMNRFKLISIGRCRKVEEYYKNYEVKKFIQYKRAYFNILNTSNRKHKNKSANKKFT